MSTNFEQAARDIIATGQRLDARGLAPATAGNYSVRLSDGDLAITVSGQHKGRMDKNSIMRIGAGGVPRENKKPSAETLLHIQLYKRYPDANAILHTHSVYGIALTRGRADLKNIRLENYELLKAFPNIKTHEAAIDIPVFNNSQDMQALADEVEAVLKDDTHAYIIRDHGIYVWGRDIAEAERIVEALEHLLACEIEITKLRGAAA